MKQRKRYDLEQEQVCKMQLMELMLMNKKELANLYKGITKGSTRRNRYTSQTLQEAL
ncbi:MAG: hypothetical protein SOY68_09960 [Fusobacterium varium]|uniref:hypothetical protein n=1 Tax=uncultured Fusobacterium sp. TaxID=159267 RepID=UPI0028FC2D42|nr:hypothetical protein [Fusobacterium varium]MDY4006223.1 hypothetical protein [Fusobacterium varium]